MKNDYTKKLGKVIEINEAHIHDHFGRVGTGYS